MLQDSIMHASLTCSQIVSMFVWGVVCVCECVSLSRPRSTLFLHGCLIYSVEVVMLDQFLLCTFGELQSYNHLISQKKVGSSRGFFLFSTVVCPVVVMRDMGVGVIKQI
jgi:hypothetical protein